MSDSAKDQENDHNDLQQDDQSDAEEEFISDSLPEDSFLISYFHEIQSTFWIELMMPYFMLENKKVESFYRPRILLWTPHLLTEERLGGLKCSSCNSKMETKGFNRNPHARRIVDLTICFYLMSMRYRCLSPRCGNIVNGHDGSIVKQLLLELQMRFPSFLTHKGGVSKAAADLLKPCIQNSVDPERFRKFLLEMHHLRHNRLELQYLLSFFRKRNSIARRFHQSELKTYSAFEDQRQYSDYVPTSTYIRILYTAIIETLRPKMGKHMILLDGKLLKGNHSFKFPKHVTRIEETSVFTALYTVTNEHEKIVQQSLVPSKALSYLRYPFEKMHEAYSLYGHEMPIAFFTDNIKGDKSFLEAFSNG
ncbi:hypothetical protein A0J61_05984 [Choanephora cucurbitarum]|uniref:DUF6729 domain-containing protein n=1 Tax=Choanephora cucurbitarum TaxID=101091 RepID=A0A1C7NBF5_9FUNG|nr:hypothetical protein A0J61_05984 [Choanephora cucurbitarum]